MFTTPPALAPRHVSDRVEGVRYLFRGEVRTWNGQSWCCQHGINKGLCSTCGGSKLCEHGKQRANCMPCSSCPHGKKRSRCMACGGVGICVHGTRKGTCVPCGGSETCPHLKVRSQCKECGGQRFCTARRSPACRTRARTSARTAFNEATVASALRRSEVARPSVSTASNDQRATGVVAHRSALAASTPS